MALLEVCDVTKRFGGLLALHRVSCTVEQGQITGLIGPNGAGKTTLLRILASRLIPDSGTVRIFGEPLAQKGKKAFRSRVSFLPADDRGFYWHLSGRHNLEFFAGLHGWWGKKARRKIGEATSKVGLERLDAPYQEYSSGMRQRLALARALMQEATLLLMDEPTRSLDPSSAQNFRQLIRATCRHSSRTILVITHNLEEAQQLGDRIVILAGGKIRACGSPAELKKITAGGQETSLLEAYHLLTGEGGGHAL